MRPPFSVVFLTTLCGAAQGLLIALVGMEIGASAGTLAMPPQAFFVAGAGVSVVLGALGLLASFFHLGHPERAWRAIAMWRTSWLSRECLAVPAFLALTFLYGLAHVLGWPHTLAIGVVAACAAAVLFLCTAMIYACLRFLQEWASPFTLVNFVLLGCASGFTLATLVAAACDPPLVRVLGPCACILIAAGCMSRMASLARNARLYPKSTLQSATGIRADKVVQKSQGFTSSSFNMREFFHGKSPAMLATVKTGFVLGAFVVPFILVMFGSSLAAPVAILAAAFVIQYLGLLAERWFFFAEARHPQNLYYQRAA
ncbi:dimethyl sulfoxide reductase anchor subunit family protein [Bordetella bronchialis]|uniref:DMSO reductase n=1 Tax=Bordetella bronchialis TaxID=463025 RepID=A0A193FIP9_9BORD|nr:DmsC/YnfH family molybdoenzyme membrane anchor subunit [Bordetella bronchialis]ANN66984.1 DMSO reductase [Bordetella bronchialis]ANN72059.1 DMSO reductase [Bordetella bronchialis]